MLLTNATLATMTSDDGFGLLADSAVAMQDGQITWVGPMSDVPDTHRDGPVHDLEGRLVTRG